MSKSTATVIENVTFKAKGRRWEFGVPGYSFATPVMPGGRETAIKVARQLNGGSKRMKGKGIDGTASKAVTKLLFEAGQASRRTMSPIGTFFAE